MGALRALAAAVTAVPSTGAIAGPRLRGGGTHRYWEVHQIGPAMNEAHGVPAEVVFAATTGGPSLIGASSNGSLVGVYRPQSALSVTSAFDGNPSSAPAVPGLGHVCLGVSWRYDFGAPTLVRALRLTNNTSNPARMVSSFCVRGSNDAVTWQTYLIVMQTPWAGVQETREWALRPRLPSTTNRAFARGWAIRVLANDGSVDRTSVADMRWKATAGGANLTNLASGAPGSGTVAGMPFADRSGGTDINIQSPEKAFNGVATDRWRDNVTSGSYVGWLFPAGQDCAEVDILAFNIEANSMPRDFEIIYTSDFCSWNVARTVTGQTGWTPSAYRTFAIP